MIDKNKKSETKGFVARSEGSLAANVTPPPLRLDGVTLAARLRCLVEIRTGRGKKSGWLTANDRGCLEFIGEQGTVTIDQLWRSLLSAEKKTRSLRHLYRRVEFWQEQGLVQSFTEPGSKRLYLKLTRRAVSAVSTLSIKQLPFPAPPKSELAHTLALTEFRLAAVALGKVARWVSDRSLRTDSSFPTRLGNYCPDAYWVTPSGRRIFLEYERTRKTKARRREKYEHFAREMGRADKSMDMVVWIADGACLEMLESIVRIAPNQKVFSTQSFFAELGR